MKIQIKNRCTDAVIFETDSETIGGAVAAAISAKANLSGANLSGADLSGADLSRANLSGADLSRADLSRANLYGANLYGANLYGANLYGANLYGANLYGANLYGANLSKADLSRANLDQKQLDALLPVRTILPEGDLIGWKKLLGGVICKLRIPADAKRVGGLIGRKCRAEFAVVLEGDGKSAHDPAFAYKVGETVRPDKFDPNPLEECSGGIHFFITRQEAENY